MTLLETSLEELAYNTIRQQQPNLIVVLGQLLQRGETPRQIAKFIERRDIFLASIAEMAAVWMQKQIPTNGNGADQQKQTVATEEEK